jgi:thioredoxin 1
MSQATAVTTNAFETEVLQSPVPVLVDFWATWCSPCRALAPDVDALAAEYAERVKVVKVDVDNEQELAGKYGVQSVPTLMLFKRGVVVDQVIGRVPKRVLAGKLEAVLA